MAPPWRAKTTKDLGNITHATRPAPAGHRFAAPSPLTTVRFNRQDFCLSMARASALSTLTSTTPLASSLSTAMRYFVTVHVDDAAPAQLHFLDSVTGLGDSTRSYFSSCIGAGIADLYARRLGYRFNCNAREVRTPTRTQIGDYLYAGGPARGPAAVMVEAKGSLQSSFYPTTFRAVVDAGYTQQVEKHLGQTYPSRIAGRRALKIVHGYAIGCGGELTPATPSAVIGHVVETASSPRGSGAGGGAHGGGGDGGGGGGGGDDPDGLTASAPVVLGNFRAVATLLGDPGLIDLIDDARHGERLTNARIPATLSRVDFRGEQFYEFAAGNLLSLATSPEERNPDSAFAEPLRFALWAPMLDALIENLANDGAVWEMPAIDRELQAGPHEDGGAVQADGLALLPQWFEDTKIRLGARELPPATGQIVAEPVIAVAHPGAEHRQRELEMQVAGASLEKLTR